MQGDIRKCGGEMLRKERETTENARKKGETAKQIKGGGRNDRKN